jgi:hypothetical protein
MFTTDTKLFRKAWIGSAIKGIRESEKRNTYDWFAFDKLPPIPKNLDNSFTWLKPVLKGKELRHTELSFMEEIRGKHYGEGVDFSEDIVRLESELKSYTIKLPEEIRIFFCNTGINGRIRSTTDCYWKLGDFIGVIAADQVYYILRFMSDSQGCLFWYICFDQTGNHFIMASPRLYGHENQEEHNQYVENSETLIGYYCADCFKEFIYRYDIEQRIWLKTHWYIADLESAEQEYVNSYQSIPLE